MAILEDPLRLVVGDKAAKTLDRALELRTVGDLLRHYPRRYETRGELTDLAELRDGEYVTVQAEIARVTSRPWRGRRGSIFEATVTGADQGEVAAALADVLLSRGGELVTLMEGAGSEPGLARRVADDIAEASPGLEVVCYDGGPVPLLIGVE